MAREKKNLVLCLHLKQRTGIKFAPKPFRRKLVDVARGAARELLNPGVVLLGFVQNELLVTYSCHEGPLSLGASTTFSVALWKYNVYNPPIKVFEAPLFCQRAFLAQIRIILYQKEPFSFIIFGIPNFLPGTRDLEGSDTEAFAHYFSFDSVLRPRLEYCIPFLMQYPFPLPQELAVELDDGMLINSGSALLFYSHLRPDHRLEKGGEFFHTTIQDHIFISTASSMFTRQPSPSFFEPSGVRLNGKSTIALSKSASPEAFPVEKRVHLRLLKFDAEKYFSTMLSKLLTLVRVTDYDIRVLHVNRNTRCAIVFILVVGQFSCSKYAPFSCFNIFLQLNLATGESETLRISSPRRCLSYHLNPNITAEVLKPYTTEIARQRARSIPITALSNLNFFRTGRSLEYFATPPTASVPIIITLH